MGPAVRFHIRSVQKTALSRASARGRPSLLHFRVCKHFNAHFRNKTALTRFCHKPQDVVVHGSPGFDIWG
jgi:hypothetical protein